MSISADHIPLPARENVADEDNGVGCGKLFLGNIAAAQDSEYLRSALECRFVVTVMHDASDTKAKLDVGVEHLHVDLLDDNNTSMGPFFGEDYLGKIDTHLRRHENVLVHCSSGISRSSTLVIAYLIRHRDLDLRTAYQLVRESRPVIQPGTTFFDDLQRLEMQVCSSEQPSLSLVDYYAFAVQSLLAADGIQRDFADCARAVQIHGYVSDMNLLMAAQSLQR